MKFPVFDFLAQFGATLPALFAPLLLAWIATFIVVIGVILFLRTRIKPHILQVDSRIRAWARTLRYEDVTSTGPGSAERHARTFFFRFWTNFASAPSLILQSLILAIWATGNTSQPRLFWLPGICYAASMLLSWVSKRVFKRVRPVREEGAFGHKLKDGSFPSGHSLTCFCFWMMLVAVANIAGATGFGLGALLLGAILIIAFTGLRRGYLGVHFPTVVLGGYSIGLVWCSVCYFALRPIL